MTAVGAGTAVAIDALTLSILDAKCLAKSAAVCQWVSPRCVVDWSSYFRGSCWQSEMRGATNSWFCFWAGSTDCEAVCYLERDALSPWRR